MNILQKSEKYVHMDLIQQILIIKLMKLIKKKFLFIHLNQSKKEIIEINLQKQYA